MCGQNRRCQPPNLISTARLAVVPKQLSIILLVTWVIACVGCQSEEERDYRKWVVDTALEHAENAPHIVLVHVAEDWYERFPTPHSKGVFVSKGVVVRSYKGDWKAGEPICFRQETESEWQPKKDYLTILMLDYYSTGRVGIDTGQQLDYYPELDQALRHAPGMTDGNSSKPNNP